MNTEHLLVSEFLGSHPAEAAQLFEELSPSETVDLLRQAAPQSAAAVVRAMAPMAAAALLAKMPLETAVELSALLPLETLVAILHRMTAEPRQAFLEALPEERRGQVDVLLRYPEGTAGSLMDPLVRTIPADIAVDEALRRVRDDAQHLYDYVYVLDRAQHLAGVVGLQQLLLADPAAQVSTIMTGNVASLSDYATLETIRAHPGWKLYHALPVVDDHDIFLGAIPHTLLRQIEEAAASRDAQTGFGSLVALGELYWVGMCELFGGLSSARLPPPAPTKIDRDIRR